MKLSAISVVAATLLASASAHASVINLINNGSFEVNAVGNGSWTTLSSMSGWTVGQNGVEVRNNVAGAASNGSNYVELDTSGNSWIRQTIATTSSHLYTLSFDYSPREGSSWNTNGIEVLWGGQSVGVFSGNSSGPGNHWQHISLQLDSFGPSTALEFRAVGASDSIGGSLDNVALSAAVPEPGTLASIALGLGLLGFTLRRKA